MQAPAAPAAQATSDTAAPAAPRLRDRRWLAAGVMLAVVGLPLVVAAIALRRPQWYPVLDLAMTELRLRDVGTGHAPLIGLPGRIGPSLAEQGSHPGPLSFYLLAGPYRALGSSAWAMQAGTVVLNLLAVAAALAMAARRGGARLVIAVGAVVALLTAGYGLSLLTLPWNPYLPLLWWLVFLLAVWSVLCGDVAMLPVAVFAGSFAAQTHVPYVGLTAGLAVLAVGGAAVAWRRAGAGSPERRRVLRWGIGALALGVALWVPTLVDEAVNEPGNLQRIYDHLVTATDTEDEPVGLRRGVELALMHLDVGKLFGGTPAGGPGGVLTELNDPLLPGVAVLLAWAVAATASLRLGVRPLARLHLVVAAGLVLGVVSMSRILGKEWFYLMLWAWAVTALLLLAVGWTVVAALRARQASTAAPHRLATATGAATAALVVGVMVSSGLATAEAVDVDPLDAHVSSSLGALVPDTVAALERGEGAATGTDGRYMVTWNDALYFGSQGYGLVSELERAGFTAGLDEVWHVPITDHRVITPDEATAMLVLANARNIERWRQVPEAVEVAFVEPRNVTERTEYANLRDAVIDDLQADGLDDIVPMVDENLFGASIDERVPLDTQRLMARMLVLGQPAAIFITPPDAAA